MADMSRSESVMSTASASGSSKVRQAEAHRKAALSVDSLITMAIEDAIPDLAPSLRAMEPVQRVVVLQCIYYAHMFLVLREKALKRRVRIEQKKKKKLSGTFEGQEDRQEAYLAKRAAMMKQFGVDDSNTAEAQQVAQIEALIAELEATLEKKGSDVRIGIIGGGRIGTQLLDMLIRCGTFPTDQIKLSTRRPEGLLEYQAQGVRCYYDNAAVAGACEVLFLCCLPAHLPRVAADIASAGPAPNLLVVSAVGGMTADKIQTMLGVPTVRSAYSSPRSIRYRSAARSAHERSASVRPCVRACVRVWYGGACVQVLRPIVHPPVVADEITAALDFPDELTRYEFSNMAAMVELAAEQITDDKQNIYTILFALQRWCEALELSVGEARKVALFCIIGDPERGLEPLEQFRCVLRGLAHSSPASACLCSACIWQHACAVHSFDSHVRVCVCVCVCVCVSLPPMGGAAGDSSGRSVGFRT
jgi:hypothetical protein